MRSHLVGRGREVSQLVELLSAAHAGRGVLAILCGEPGIGKTSLATAAAAEAERLGFRVAWGRAWEAGGAPAFYPWTEALSGLGLDVPDASLATAVEGDAARFQLFRRVAQELRRASSASPILLVLDDVHIADVSSLRMLHFVAREIAQAKVAIVATRRDVEPGLTPELESTLAKIAREGKTFVLSRLERDDVARIVRKEGPRVPAELEPEIWRASQGNPLFVGELVRLLDSNPSLAELPIPYGAREILRQRLGALDADARAILELAAVAGVDVPEALLLAAAEPSAVRTAVESAARVGVLVAGGERDRRVRFAHALWRDALYRDLAPSRRAELHRRIADAVEATPSTPPPMIEIAHHAIEAAGVDDHLVPRVVRAAQALSASFADEDAIRLLERALQPSRGDASRGVDLAILLGELRIRVGDVVGGRASCVRAADAARSLGDARLLARAALAHAGEVTQGQTNEATHHLLVEALERLGESDVGLAARLRARLAASLQPAPDPAAVARAALDAVATARTLGDDAALLDVIHNAGGAFAEAWFSPEVVDVSRDAVRLAERLGDRAKLLRGRIRLILGLMELGDFASADANIDALEEEAAATAQARHMWAPPLLRAMRALHGGRLADDEALTAVAAEIGASDPGAKGSVFLHRYARARAEARGADLLALEPQLLAGIARWNDSVAYSHLMSATIRAHAGELDVARKHLAQLPRGSIPERIRIARGVLANTVIRVADTGRAAELYEQLLPEEGRWHILGFAGFAVEATYSRYLGGLAALLGRVDEADRHYERALTQAEAASARPEHARVLAARAALGGPTPPRAPEEPRRAFATSLALIEEGETWQLTLGAASARLKASRGVGYIARLVASPARELHVLDLAGAADGADAGDAGEALDDEAQASYKRRLAELDEELREAEGWNDGARATRARTEIELLSAELSRAVGLGGRQRRVGSAAERARVAVTRRVRDTIRRAAAISPEIGRHLEATIKTGLYCVYRPL